LRVYTLVSSSSPTRRIVITDPHRHHRLAVIS